MQGPTFWFNIQMDRVITYFYQHYYKKPVLNWMGLQFVFDKVNLGSWTGFNPTHKTENVNGKVHFDGNAKSILQYFTNLKIFTLMYAMVSVKFLHTIFNLYLFNIKVTIGKAILITSYKYKTCIFCIILFK